MGAKQSKRSVDISGKEGEGGGEVAAAGAGGEGRVEQLADADALKPQLNGDAHIQHEQTVKEKELDSGTPENEKDATTEKEGKEDEEKDKESTPVTNGETDQKVENGETTPTPEDGKKPKKEKVKKKWSLRSISFSRKDKPKQEKKQKEEEPKTNGEPEKVPEETAEASPEPAANEVAEEAKVSVVEEKDEKTPETPVTEPLTNGSSTPDSLPPQTPPAEEPAPPLEPKPEPAPAPEPTPEPEQLPVNGLSLEDTKPETPAVEEPEQTKAEPPVTETAEIAPAPEIPKEVCVERMPLLEPTPPPLPANPPPSSVASFAASTMAPELTDASLANNTADATIAPLSALSDTKDIIDARVEPPTPVNVTETLENKLPAPLKEITEDAPAEVVKKPSVEEKEPVANVVHDDKETKRIDGAPCTDIETVKIEASQAKVETTIPESVLSDMNEPVKIEIVETNIENVAIESQTCAPEPVLTETPVIEKVKSESVEGPVNTEIVNLNIEVNCVENNKPKVETPVATETEIVHNTIDIQKIEPTTVETSEVVPTESAITNSEIVEINEIQNKTDSLTEVTPPEPVVSELSSPVSETAPVIIDPVDVPEPEDLPEPELDTQEASEESSLPPPPIEDEDEAANSLEVDESLKQIPEPIAADVVEANGEMTNGVHDASDDIELKKKVQTAAKCNGEEEQPASAAPHTPQEPLPVSDKLADLIPEIPDVPELKTETLQETSTDVAVAN